MPELWQFPAHRLTEGYASGAFTPVEVLASVLARCDAINPTINAVIARNDAAAQTMAEDSAARWRAGEPASALDGVPISIKDNLLVEGFPATWGSRGLRDHAPDYDEDPVARLRQGGAVLFAKTNVPELTVQGYTDNLLFGATGLPFAPDLTPGGSSGGAASAVAAGIGPLALCTDGGGSIRRPAAHAGLFGFKPGSGRIARGAGFPAILGDFEVVGPIGRTARDVATMFALLAAAPQLRPAPGRCRILYARHFMDQPVAPEILARCDAAAAQWELLGHHVTRVDSLDTFAPIDTIWPVISTAGVAWLSQNRPEIAATMGPAVQAMAESGQRLLATDYVDALLKIEEMRRAFATTMDGFDVLMTPTVAALSWPKAQSHPEQIAGRPVGPRGHAVFTAFANALGLPGLAIPVRPATACGACGVQLVGHPGDDERLLSLAVQWDAHTTPDPESEDRD